MMEKQGAMLFTTLSMDMASAVLWCITYILIFRQAYRDRTYAMPFLAMCANIVWEFYFSFIYHTAMWWVDLAWFILDIGIVLTYMKFWRTDYPPNLSPKWVWLRMTVVCMAAGGLLIATVNQVGDTMANLHLAFADNLVMSLAFIAMLVQRGSRSGQSMAIAWTKLFGSLTASVGSFIAYPHDHLFNVVYVQIFFFDLSYVIMLAKPSWWLSQPTEARAGG